MTNDASTRRVPFVLVAREHDIPGEMARGGVLLDYGTIHELRGAIESLPNRATEGMDLSIDEVATDLSDF
jgi:hypothetical protein